MNGKALADVRQVKVGNLNVDIYAHGDRICDHLAAGNGFEPDTLKFWAGLCAKAGGRTILDVGGYTGLFSIAAAKFGAKAICFEPMPENVKRIQANADLNKVEIDIRPFAVSDASERTMFRFNPMVKGLTSGGSLLPSEKRTKQIDVLAVPLDALELTDCAALKIDVEGGEQKVLQGARRTIRRFRPPIIVEVLHARAESQIRGELLSLDYRLHNVFDVRNWLLMAI